MRKKIIQLLFCAAIIFNLLPQRINAEAVSITKQPLDVSVAYPHGTSFTVEVNDKDSVASYQWIAVDKQGNEYVLDGSSAVKETLVVPSTTPEANGYSFYCLISTKDGKQIVSDKAVLTIRNYLVNRTVLYVCDQAIEAGQTLDLSETDLGSGTISFEDNGSDIVFNNVHIDNATLTCSHLLAPARGLLIYSHNLSNSSFFLDINGECEINNSYIDENNINGVTIGAEFSQAAHTSVPSIVIGGSGSLKITGGDVYIKTPGLLSIFCNLEGYPNEERLCEGFSCKQLQIIDEAVVKLKTPLTAIRCESNFDIFDSSLYIQNNLQHQENGPSMTNGILAFGDMCFEHSYVEISTEIADEHFVPFDKYVAYYNGIALLGRSGIIMSSSYVNVDVQSDLNEKQYVMNVKGIYSSRPESYMNFSGGADLFIDIDTPNALDVSGIDFKGSMYVTEETSINVKVKGDGEVYGINIGDYIYAEDSQIDIGIDSPSKEKAFGFLTGDYNFSTENNTFHLHSDAGDGIAFALIGETQANTPVSFDPDYEPASALPMVPELECFLPIKYAINHYSRENGTSFATYETFYDLKDTSFPASEVLIEVAERIDSSYLLVTSSLSVLAAVNILVRFFWRGIRK